MDFSNGEVELLVLVVLVASITTISFIILSGKNDYLFVHLLSQEQYLVACYDELDRQDCLVQSTAGTPEASTILPVKGQNLQIDIMQTQLTQSTAQISDLVQKLSDADSLHVAAKLEKKHLQEAFERTTRELLSAESSLKTEIKSKDEYVNKLEAEISELKGQACITHIARLKGEIAAKDLELREKDQEVALAKENLLMKNEELRTFFAGSHWKDMELDRRSKVITKLERRLWTAPPAPGTAPHIVHHQPSDVPRIEHESIVHELRKQMGLRDQDNRRLQSTLSASRTQISLLKNEIRRLSAQDIFSAPQRTVPHSTGPKLLITDQNNDTVMSTSQNAGFVHIPSPPITPELATPSAVDESLQGVTLNRELSKITGEPSPPFEECNGVTVYHSRLPEVSPIINLPMTPSVWAPLSEEARCVGHGRPSLPTHKNGQLVGHTGFIP